MHLWESLNLEDLMAENCHVDTRTTGAQSGINQRFLNVHEEGNAQMPLKDLGPIKDI